MGIIVNSPYQSWAPCMGPHGFLSPPDSRPVRLPHRAPSPLLPYRVPAIPLQIKPSAGAVPPPAPSIHQRRPSPPRCHSLSRPPPSPVLDLSARIGISPPPLSPSSYLAVAATYKATSKYPHPPSFDPFPPVLSLYV